MRTTNLCMKHTGSSLPDVFFKVEIDDHNKRVVVHAEPFDSAMLARLVTVVLVDDFGVVAFDDDNVPGVGRGRALYDLKVEFDGLRFEAVVTKMMAAVGAGTTVGLSPSKQC